MNPDKELAEVIKECASEVVGAENVSDFKETGGSEDVTFLMTRVQQHGGQAAHFYYGSDDTGPHRSDFDPDDEKSMPVGFTIQTKLLLKKNGIH